MSLPPPNADGCAEPEHRPAIAGYDLLEVVGRGGMGVVWRAREHASGREIALKLRRLDTAEETAATMWAEARIAARIGHPAVVPVHDVGLADDGSPFYTMELVRGRDLGAVLGGGPLPEARAIAIAADVASAIAAAHALGIVHRDLKPANVLLDQAGNVRVVDFGLAVVTASPSASSAVQGTLNYMAPEQIDGRTPAPPIDVFALGVLLYQMLTGRRPFEAAAVGRVLSRIRSHRPDAPGSLVSGVRPEVDRLCLACLEKRPEDRPTARALAAALHALSGNDDAGSPRAAGVGLAAGDAEPAPPPSIRTDGPPSSP